MPIPNPNNFDCPDWCHCRKCGGFKLGGMPYGHSCSCPEELKRVEKLRKEYEKNETSKRN